MFTFTITPENRIAVETILLIVCSLAAMFITQPLKESERVSAKARRAIANN
ncbi:MAG TPA: hypothetical protein VNT75_16545 [Symbiobacteriaceae bacterium]|nr:hypothetical protein [Symbiobacteriaceae bacterium]